MSNRSSTFKVVSPRPDVWIAYVFTSFSGGKETKVFTDLDDAKRWCKNQRTQILSGEVANLGNPCWAKSAEGFYFLTGVSLVGAVQIEPHTIIRPRVKTEIIDVNGDWKPIPKCFKADCTNRAEGIFMRADAGILAGYEHICKQCTYTTKGTFEYYEEHKLR